MIYFFFKLIHDRFESLFHLVYFYASVFYKWDLPTIFYSFVCFFTFNFSYYYAITNMQRSPSHKSDSRAWYIFTCFPHMTTSRFKDRIFPEIHKSPLSAIQSVLFPPKSTIVPICGILQYVLFVSAFCGIYNRILLWVLFVFL